MRDSRAIRRAPTGWHYQRQLKIVTAKDAPEGQRYVTFSNAEPGRNSQALQGFAVDGRKVAQLQLSARVRGKDIQPARTPQQLPGHRRRFLRREPRHHRRSRPGPVATARSIGKPKSNVINVPPKAREAMLRIGLFGAVGEISFDEIEVKAGEEVRGLGIRD